MSQHQVHHNAPAGQKYTSIQDAGRSTLETYCDKYPNTTSSFVIPNLFPSAFPDVIDNPQVSLTDKQKKQFDGFVRNLAGEREEYEIYLAFNSLTRKSPAHPILVIWGLKFDSDNSRAIKRNALKSELPSIQLGPGEMSQEKDFIIFVRNCGVVFGEVKKSASEVNIEKAEEQLEKAVDFFQKMMRAIVGPSGRELPISKLILVPSESGPSPAIKTPSGSLLVFNDMVQNFQKKWSEVVNELEESVANNPMNPSDFERLVQITTGIWSMRPFQKKFFQFNDDQASLASNIQTIDKSISCATLCSEKGAQFTSNVSSSSVTEVIDRDEELNILYFSPQQKLIFDDYKHALIRAHAGCGKTLLILIKILDILEKDFSQKILLIAAKPHHLRCKNILERNNVTVEIFPSFPLPPTSSPPSCQVVIVELQKFFKVPSETLLSYDISLFHLLVDDLHGYKLKDEDNCSDFTDIGDFVDYAYSVSKLNDKLCWFGLDVAQQCHYGRSYGRNGEESKVTGLFLTNSGLLTSSDSRRTFNIPVVVMNQILRNSKEIIMVLESARETQAKVRELNTSMMIPDIHCGHHITSQKLVYHKLNVYRLNEVTKKKFVCARIEELLNTLSSSFMGHPVQKRQLKSEASC